MNVLPFHVRVGIASCLAEGNSLASTARLMRVQPNTVMRFALQLGRGCDRLHRARVRNLYCHTIEVDEIWGFIQKKQKRVKPTDPREFGDAYTFVALDAPTKFVLSYLTDKRTGEAATRFMRDLRARVVGKPQITSDGFEPYVAAVEAAFGTGVHYAMLVKEYEADSARQDAAHRYSPGEVIGATKRVITGHPIEESISTSYIESNNLRTRMGVRRMTRLTNAFSKRLEGLRASLALHFAARNWVFPHLTLRTTPAAEIGLAKGPWSMAELVEAALGELETLEPEPEPEPAPVAVVGGVTTARVVGNFRVIEGGRR